MCFSRMHCIFPLRNVIIVPFQNELRRHEATASIRAHHNHGSGGVAGGASSAYGNSTSLISSSAGGGGGGGGGGNSSSNVGGGGVGQDGCHKCSNHGSPFRATEFSMESLDDTRSISSGFFDKVREAFTLACRRTIKSSRLMPTV